MKKIFTLFTAALFAASLWGTEDVISRTIEGTTASTSAYFPIGFNMSVRNTLSQQLYFASEIGTDLTSKKIVGIEFYLNSTTAKDRTIEVWIDETTKTNLASATGTGKQFYYHDISKSKKSDYSAGTKVLVDSIVSLPASNGWYRINFNKVTPYTWNGGNIVLTINDKTKNYATSKTHKTFTSTDARCIYTNNNNSTTSFDATDLYSVAGTAVAAAPAIKFIFEGSPTPTYDAPTSVSVLSKSSSTATIGWTKKDSATIKLQYKVQGAGSWIDSVGITGNSKQLNGLSAETTYDYQIFAVYPTGTSSAVTGSFTTDEASDHEHDGISFVAWNETTSLPTSAGNYYLKNNVTVSSWTVPSGDTKICLNGKTITFSSGYITVGSSQSLSIYDNEGNGTIAISQSFFPAIKVNGGALALFGGSVNNTASSTEAFAVSVESGSFSIKGNVKMSTSASAANIYLKNSGSIITLIGAITNSAKLSVKKAANQNITSGWSTQMGSADPADFFSSKNTDAPAVVLVGDEAQLGVPAVTISETGSNTIENGKLTNVNLVRTFQANILNTIALPFALTDDQLQDVFGDDYELYELSSSSLVGNVLELMFSKVTSLTGGAPYLLRISESKVNPSFSSVTLTTATPSKATTAVTMMPVISEKEVKGADYNLFLNAAGELNWATQTASFKGMRAYFHVTAAMPPSGVAVRRIVLGTDAATDLDNLEVSDKAVKRIENGQLVILKNGNKYNVQGQIIK